MIRLVTQGFLLGLSMGTVCLFTCGPIYASYLMRQGGKGYGPALRNMLGIFVGRFIGYSIFGSLAGLIGTKAAIRNHPIMTVIAYLISGTFLVLTSISGRRGESGCSMPRVAKLTKQPALLGLATGINYCPPFLVALAYAVISGGIIVGTLFFVAFFFGTSVMMVPLFMFGVLPGRRTFRVIGVIASLVVAAWLFISAISIIAGFRGSGSG